MTTDSSSGSRPFFWTVAQTVAQRESVAVYGLKQSGFECYLPRITTKVRGNRQIVPLFPTYVFVRIVDRWHAVAKTKGVIRVLMAGDRPAQLSEQIMDEIRRREGRDGLIRLALRRPSIGSKVRVLSGQFRGYVGLYDGMTSRERERVLLELLGRSVPVELAPNDQIEALHLVHSS